MSKRTKKVTMTLKIAEIIMQVTCSCNSCYSCS